MIFKGESGLEQRISIERIEEAINIFGSFDENIRLLEQEFSVTVVNRDGELRVDGEPENTMLAVKAIGALQGSAQILNKFFCAVRNKNSCHMLHDFILLII